MARPTRVYVALAVSAFFVLSADRMLAGQEGQGTEQALSESVSVVKSLTGFEREGFRRALAGQDERYDPKERMIKRPFSSPGYHTTL